MEWLIAILTVVCTPLATILVQSIKEKNETKRKQLELKDKKESYVEEKISNCSSVHTANLDRITKDFKSDLQNLSDKLQGITDVVNEVKASNQQTSSTVQLEISQLRTEVSKHNSVIERTFKLEERCSVLENREKVSEKRLSDLERHEEHRNEIIA